MQKRKSRLRRNKLTNTLVYLDIWDKTNRNFTTGNMHHKQRPRITKYLLMLHYETTTDAGTLGTPFKYNVSSTMHFQCHYIEKPLTISTLNQINQSIFSKCNYVFEDLLSGLRQFVATESI